MREQTVANAVNITAGEIETWVMTVLAERFGVENELSPGVSLKVLGIDSLGGVQLSLALKKKYGVAFVAGEIKVDFTLGEIAALTRGKLSGHGGLS